MTPQSEQTIETPYEAMIKKIQWKIDYYTLHLDKCIAAKEFLEKHPDAVKVAEGFAD